MSYAIDVIVPVYNRAHCIANLVAELKKQTFQDFRVIFVDDGSTDNSCDVIDELLPQAGFPYAIIRKENGGAGSARNAGLRAATAEWISFVDSDDALQPEFLEYFYTAATQTHADIRICSLQMIPEGSGQTPAPLGPLTYHKLSAADGMRIFCSNWIGPYCVFMNRRFQQENSLFFDEACTYCEDAPFITNVIAAAHTIAHIPLETYIYYTYQGGKWNTVLRPKILMWPGSLPKWAASVITLPPSAGAQCKWIIRILLPWPNWWICPVIKIMCNICSSGISSWPARSHCFPKLFFTTLSDYCLKIEVIFVDDRHSSCPV